MWEKEKNHEWKKKDNNPGCKDQKLHANLQSVKCAYEIASTIARPIMIEQTAWSSR